MKIFTAAIVTETNTFSPIPTGMQAFQLNGVQHGSRAPINASSELAAVAHWRACAERDGHSVVESVAAVAEPAGITVAAVYEALRDELLADLRAALPVDAVLLFLHGAMVAQGYDDCEGDILARVRAIVGPDVPVAAELDPHSHLTNAMLEHATLLIAYDEYPHTDIVARGEDLYRLCVAAANGEIRPVMHAFDCRAIGLFPTSTQPMRGFVDRLKAERRGPVLSTSFIHGFPWGDVPDTGAKCLAVCDNDAQLALELSAFFGRQFWSMRTQMQIRAHDIDAAIDAALASAKTPVVLADVADNAGGGAPGDSTYILQRLLERGVSGIAAGVYYDPVAVQMCFEAGEGSVLDLRCGGKLGKASGMPLDLRVRVRKLREEHFQSSMDDSGPVALGRSAWVEAEGVHLVLASIRCQVFAPDAFTDLGLSLDDKRIIVVKSSHHFWAKFEPIAGMILHVNSPGALQIDFAGIPYSKRAPDYWPRVSDPFSAV